MLTEVSWTRANWLQLCDLLFGYLYNYRITSFTHDCSESAWNIRKLSRTLSGFVVPNEGDSLEYVIGENAVRGLTYPLHRAVASIRTVALDDLPKLVGMGRTAILKALLQIKVIFESKDPYYLHNRVFIDDFIIWVQRLKQDRFDQYVKEMGAINR